MINQLFLLVGSRLWCNPCLQTHRFGASQFLSISFLWLGCAVLVCVLWTELFSSKVMPAVALAGESHCGAIRRNLHVDKPCFSLVLCAGTSSYWQDVITLGVSWTGRNTVLSAERLSHGNACLTEARHSPCASLRLTGVRTMQGCLALPCLMQAGREETWNALASSALSPCGFGTSLCAFWFPKEGWGAILKIQRTYWTFPLMHLGRCSDQWVRLWTTYSTEPNSAH